MGDYFRQADGASDVSLESEAYLFFFAVLEHIRYHLLGDTGVLKH